MNRVGLPTEGVRKLVLELHPVNLMKAIAKRGIV